MRRRAALLASLLCLLAEAAAAQPAILVFDAAMGMWGRTGERARIDIAREAVSGLMARWPAQRPVGLVAYGHRRGSDCADVELLRAPATDPAAVAALAREVTPRGRTPAADALRLAAEALGAGGGSVILLAAGIETCHPDPCAVAQRIARSDPRIVVHTIAFALADPAALAQLRCMAEATGGRALAARDAEGLVAALERAAAAPAPGTRAASPRAEPVPLPRLVVTLRLCPQCDPLTAEARIVLRRGEEVVATDGEPFGRFFDLPAGDYSVTVQSALFERPPVALTIPPAGTERIEIVLDAGWLVGALRTEPSGHEVPARGGVEWSIAPGGVPPRAGAPPPGPAFLVPAGTHRLRARLGNAEAAAEATVAAGEVVVRPLGIAFGTLMVEAGAEGAAEPRVTVIALDHGATAFGEWRTAPGQGLPLAPGRYRVTAEGDGPAAVAEVEIRSEALVRLSLDPSGG